MIDQARGELVPGGLAMVVGCISNPINIGKFVTTERYVVGEDIAPDGTYYRDGSGWLCTAPGLFTGRADGSINESGYAYIDACHLLPINPEADPLSIDQRQECEA